MNFGDTFIWTEKDKQSDYYKIRHCFISWNEYWMEYGELRWQVTEDIECVFEGERVNMNEYRFFVKPGSEEEKFLLDFLRV